MSAPIRKRLALLSRGTLALVHVPPLVTRLVLGHAYYQAGMGKWTHFDNAVTLFAAVGLPLPEVSVTLVSRLETFGAIALALGLLTRPAAAILAFVMAVALATADLPRLVEALGPGHSFGPADITSFVFLLLLSWLVAYGPGAVSLDRLAVLGWRWLQGRRGATPPDPLTVLQGGEEDTAPRPVPGRTPLPDTEASYGRGPTPQAALDASRALAPDALAASRGTSGRRTRHRRR